MYDDYSDPYQEHLDFEMGAASEAQNCFTEAQQKMSSFEPDVIGHPNWDFAIKFISYYYCKATDAFVGTYVSSISYFPTSELRDQELKNLFSQDDVESLLDISIEAWDRHPKPITSPVSKEVECDYSF